MVDQRRCAALHLPANSLRGIPQKKYIISPILLDTHSVSGTLWHSYFPKGRAFMTDQNPSTTSMWRRLIDETCEILEQLIKYGIQAFAALGLFGLFFLTSLGADCLCNTCPQISIMIMVKIVAWIISALGGFCCIALVFRNSVDFIKFLLKGSREETPGRENTDEARDE